MVRQQFRSVLGGLREPGLQRQGGAPVELLSLALHQRVVQGVFEQSVLEEVGTPGRPSLPEQNLRSHQFVEFGLEVRFVHVRDGGEQLMAELAAERGG